MKPMIRLAATACALAAAVPANATVDFTNFLTVAGEATDLASLGTGPNKNRLSFGSDLTYNPRTGIYYGISDRGPGGGLIDWAPRIEEFKLTVDHTTGAISGFDLRGTRVFRQANGQTYSGLMPNLLPGGNSNTLGKSLDSEGIAHLANGHFLASDEYGPSVYEFDAGGKFIRAFDTPANILPVQGMTPNYVDGRPVITAGRQDNRGFEGLTVNADNTKAWAILQDPLVNEGNQGDGRRSRNLRIVQYDVATGQPEKQMIYRLENTDDINNRIPGTADDFNATAQGRNIGVSSITWIGGTKFLVIERDNRGLGVDELLNGAKPVGSKRVYLIDIAGASDVSNVSLANSNSLPGGVTAVSKTLFLDVNAALKAAGVTVTEKMEGLTIGPRLADGSVTLLLSTDNDFSVTQTGSGEQLDVCSGGAQVAIGAGCPSGQTLIPSYLYAFKVSGDDANLFDSSLFAAGTPEPASWGLLLGGFAVAGMALRRRRIAAA